MKDLFLRTLTSWRGWFLLSAEIFGRIFLLLFVIWQFTAYLLS